jgi:hypothetical protein
MKADFWVASRLLMVEVQGRQHTQFTPYFHKGGDLAAARATFRSSQGRDAAKVEFCRVNGFTLVALNYDGDDEAWRRSLRQA